MPVGSLLIGKENHIWILEIIDVGFALYYGVVRSKTTDIPYR